MAIARAGGPTVASVRRSWALGGTSDGDRSGGRAAGGERSALVTTSGWASPSPGVLGQDGEGERRLVASTITAEPTNSNRNADWTRPRLSEPVNARLAPDWATAGPAVGAAGAAAAAGPQSPEAVERSTATPQPEAVDPLMASEGPEETDPPEAPGLAVAGVAKKRTAAQTPHDHGKRNHTCASLHSPPSSMSVGKLLVAGGRVQRPPLGRAATTVTGPSARAAG